MSENLSSSKRRFIETWRQHVSTYMENGNICRVTIAPMTPELDSEIMKKSSEYNRAVLDGSPRQEMASPTLPSVKFSYSHVNDEAIKDHKNRTNPEKPRDKRCQSRTILPPSPTGVVVQNGLDVNVQRRREHSSNILKSTENKMAPTDANENTDGKRRSSTIAREIYEKYNMKSKTQNLLAKKSSRNGIEQYSMPWRNKTFLTLPLRFNGNIKRNNHNMQREKTFVSECNFDNDDMLDYKKTWEDVQQW